MKKIIVLLSLLLLGLSIAANALYIKVRNLQKEIAVIEIDPITLRQKIEKAPPPWVAAQVQKDLAAYAESGITSQMLDSGFYGAYAKKFNLVRFHIKEKHIALTIDEKNLKSRHFRELYAAIEKLNNLVDLPEVDFIVSLEDGFDDHPSLPKCPWFVFAKTEKNHNFVLIPDFKALTGYGRIRSMISEANKAHPWVSKATKGFWRGSTTGGQLDASNWDQIARAKLVLLSLKNPQELDARFNHIVQSAPAVHQIMKDLKMLSKSVSRPDHLNYKYLVDVDGNSCSFERYFWLLSSNSVVLKQITPNIQWYYGGLEPYKHYIPVKQDLSDLMQQLAWAKEHDEEAKAIAEQAIRFVQENLSNEDIFAYLHHLICEYAKLQLL